MTTMERVARNVRVISKARGITMRELSSRMGYKNEQTLYARLSGHAKVSVEELEEFANQLDVTPSMLLAEDVLRGRGSNSQPTDSDTEDLSSPDDGFLSEKWETVTSTFADSSVAA